MRHALLCLSSVVSARRARCVRSIGARQRVRRRRVRRRHVQPGRDPRVLHRHRRTPRRRPVRHAAAECTAPGSGATAMARSFRSRENCGDGVDNNCNGAVDENEDRDGDGFTTCGGDCCDSTECSDAGPREPGRVRCAGQQRRRRLRRQVDDTTLLCDQGLMSNSNNGEGLREGDRHLPGSDDGRQEVGRDQRARSRCPTAPACPSDVSHSIRPQFGTKVDAARRREHGACSRRGHAAAQGRHEPRVPRLRTRTSGTQDVGLPGGLRRGERRQAAERAGLPRSERRRRRTIR